MIEFTLIGETETHQISETEFVRATKNRYPYVQTKQSGQKSFYACCPCCCNSIQLVNIHNKTSKVIPHGKHTGKSIDGFPIYNETLYMTCPWARHGSYDWEGKKAELDLYEKEILLRAIDNIDRAIYYLETILGVYFKWKLKEEAIKEYFANQGWLYNIATKENLPMVVLYVLGRKRLNNLLIKKDGLLYTELKKGKIVLKLYENSSDVFYVKDPLDIRVCDFHRTTSSYDYTEIFEMAVDNAANSIYDNDLLKFKFVFDRDRYKRLCEMETWQKKEKYEIIIKKEVDKLPQTLFDK